jgi:phage terminase small subunit
MPTLDNARHERFAQELAKGKTQEEAYKEAGYKGDRTAASRLSTNVNVQARVAEIQNRAAIRTEITVANITERLLNIAAKGETKEDAPMLSVARAALMDAAKLNGLVIDKSNTTLTGPDGQPIIPSVHVEFVGKG